MRRIVWQRFQAVRRRGRALSEGDGNQNATIPSPAPKAEAGTGVVTKTTTVTVLFTDVVGSTNLRQHQGETNAHQIMNTHNEIVRRQLADHAGREIKTSGDSFMAAFESARKAVECAIGIQRALNDYNHRH